MKKLVIFLVIIGAIALGLMVTTPDRQQHVDTIKSVMKGAVSADQFLNTNFLVRDHRFYSLGFVDYDGEFIMVSVGVFNHVYTLDEDQARQLIKKKLEEINPLDFLKKD